MARGPVLHRPKQSYHVLRLKCCTMTESVEYHYYYKSSYNCATHKIKIGSKENNAICTQNTHFYQHFCKN